MATLRERFLPDHAHIPEHVVDLEDSDHYSDNSRIKGLGDGVFSIAMTLLAFTLIAELPAAPRSFADFSSNYGTLFLVYAMSFIVLGTYWIGNAILFHYIVRSDRPLMVRTVIFLLFVSLVPFSAHYLGQYKFDTVALVLYCANLICCGLGAFAIILHAARDPLMLHRVMDKRIYRGLCASFLVGPIIYTIALLLAFVSPMAAFALCVVVPLVTFFPNPFWGRLYALAVQRHAAKKNAAARRDP